MNTCDHTDYVVVYNRGTCPVCMLEKESKSWADEYANLNSDFSILKEENLRLHEIINTLESLAPDAAALVRLKE